MSLPTMAALLGSSPQQGDPTAPIVVLIVTVLGLIVFVAWALMGPSSTPPRSGGRRRLPRRHPERFDPARYRPTRSRRTRTQFEGYRNSESIDRAPSKVFFAGRLSNKKRRRRTRITKRRRRRS